MSFPESRTWIGGSPEASEVADGDALFDPNTAGRLADTRSSSPRQVDRAIDAAARAHADGGWLRLGIEGRAPYLERFADELDAVAEQIAHLDALNSGVPISVTRLFGGSNGATVRAAIARARAAGDARTLEADGRDVVVHRIPWGPAALIVPWNAPSAMAVKKLAYALAAGAPAVLKPSSASPWSAELIAEAAERAGFPSGVVSLVLGGPSVGEQLVGDPRIRAISMTGSTATGRAIAAAAGPNFTRLRLELGANNAAIVLPGADLRETADQLVSGFTKLSGQWCEAPRRVIGVGDVGPLVDALQARLSGMVIGSSLEDATELGPVAFAARKTELVAQRDALGGRVIEAGQVPPAGYFLAPTLVVTDRDPDGELFGPILAIRTARDETEALAMANTGPVGLAGYVFGPDDAVAAALGSRLDAGEIKINGTSVLDMAAESEQSFFGSAGLGGHGDAGVLDFFVGSRIVGTDAPGLPL
ncbi:MAG TPA: aldehyde dehydrogenase family protein [Pseudolysinimonas sp.]|nr:aldehyde dehydrogenase family protein [Pseudolysinimonas sp.]